MAAAKARRRIGFGRREKLVVIGILGILLVGALHFVVFNPKSEILEQAQAQYREAAGRYERLRNQNYPENRVNQYESQTAIYREQLYDILWRERLTVADVLDRSDDREVFRREAMRLREKWLEMNRDPHVETELNFIAEQSDPRMIASGNFLWNLPESLPTNANSEMIRDLLGEAQGKYRLISRLGDPRSQLERQAQFNQILQQLGVNPIIIGADQVSLPREQWACYHLMVNGVRDNETMAELPADLWRSFRLPAPIDAICALSHIELILDALTGATPFGEGPQATALLETAEANPDSLTSDQRRVYRDWLESRRTIREGDDRNLGLEEMFGVVYTYRTRVYTRILEKVEWLVDLAVEDQIASIIMVKIYHDSSMFELPDPWSPPPEPEVPEPAQMGQRNQGLTAFGEEGMPPDSMGMEEGGFAREGMYSARSRQSAAPAAPERTPEALVAPIFIQITGDYTQVWTYILDITTGPHFLWVEDLSIYTHTVDGRPLGLPEGHVAADIWVMAPMAVIDIGIDVGQQVAEHMRNRPGAGAQ